MAASLVSLAGVFATVSAAQDLRRPGLLGLREQNLYLAADIAASMYARADLCGWQTADAERSFKLEIHGLTGDPGLTERIAAHVAERRAALRPLLADRFAKLLPCQRTDHQGWRMSVMDLTARLVDNE
jgi:hypothetical protein